MHLINTFASNLNASPLSKRAVALAQTLLNRWCGGYILAFHTISTKRFREQIESLLPDRPVPLSELLDRQSKGLSTSGLFAITFDDGFRDQVLDISRASVEYDYPVTFYLPTDYIEGKPMLALIVENIIAKIPPIELPLRAKVYDLANSKARNEFFADLTTRMKQEKRDSYFPIIEEIIEYAVTNNILTEQDIFDVPPSVSWQDVAKLSKCDNLCFESHGVTHQAVISLSEKELEWELVKSKKQISSYSNTEVTHFCYPYGANESIGQLASTIVSQHYKSAVTMNRGRLTKACPYRLPRIPLYEKDNESITSIKVLTV